MRHHHFGNGRHVIRLDPGDEVVASLRDFALATKIQAAWVSGFGSLDAAVLGFLDPDAREYLRRRFEERLEIGSLTGTLSREGDRPYVHLHAVVAPRELLAYAGHLHEGKVAVLVEMVVVDLGGRLDRVRVEGSPFPALRLPGEPPPAGEPSE
jgi:hypothetical protein